MRTSALERFLRYVQIDTRSDDRSSTSPSTPGQLVLLNLLQSELQAMGVADASINEHGVLMATVPATTSRAGVPTIGFIAHVDTSPEMPGDNVKPIVHRQYDGRDLVLPDDPASVLRLADNPPLAACIGEDIVTASGLTLLGADDKAGVAEIMAAAEYLMAHPEIAHGAVRIAFTPDEEIGRGTEHFDVARFGARCAYTLDGSSRGELEVENFSADSMTFTFQGFNTHPGFAKKRMVNAIKVAADFLTRLPSGEAPETTEEYEGFVHPYVVDARVDRTSVKVLIRDFDEDQPPRSRAAARRAGARDRRRSSRLGGHDHSRRAVPQHARGAPASSGGRGLRPAGDRACGARGASEADPRRHRWLSAFVHGPADAEPLRRRAQLPLAARVGVGAGHGQGRRGDRRAVSGVGGTGYGRLSRGGGSRLK